MGPVLWGVTPIPTEGLMSLVTRTVTRNILPSSHVLLSQVGAAHANNPTAALIPELDEEGLARILRQPLAEINARRHLPRTDAGYVDFFGNAVRADEIVFRRRRFRYKGPAYYLPALDSELLPNDVRAKIASVMSPIASTADGLPEGQIGMREAALLTGQEERNLANARRLGHLEMRMCVRANRIIPTLDRSEIELIEELLHNRMGPEKFTHSLHLPQYAMAQLVDENLVSCITHPYVMAHLGPLQVQKSELKRFRDALTRGSTSADNVDDPVPLHRAARAIGGGAKPWGSILRDMLDGKIPYSITGGSMDRIMIASGDAAKLRAKYVNLSDGVRTRFVSQRDAAEILNLPLKHSHVIHVAARRGKSAHRISSALIRKLARERITLAELSARSGIHPTRLEGMLERDGCRRHDALGWMRRKAITKIARYKVRR